MADLVHFNYQSIVTFLSISIVVILFIVHLLAVLYENVPLNTAGQMN